MRLLNPKKLKTFSIVIKLYDQKNSEFRNILKIIVTFQNN